MADKEPQIGDFVYARPMASAYKKDDAYDVLLLIDDWWVEGYWDGKGWHTASGFKEQNRATAWCPLPKTREDMA